jgi:hypothetical protein
MARLLLLVCLQVFLLQVCAQTCAFSVPRCWEIDSVTNSTAPSSTVLMHKKRKSGAGLGAKRKGKKHYTAQDTLELANIRQARMAAELAVQKAEAKQEAENAIERAAASRILVAGADHLTLSWEDIDSLSGHLFKQAVIVDLNLKRGIEAHQQEMEVRAQVQRENDECVCGVCLRISVVCVCMCVV